MTDCGMQTRRVIETRTSLFKLRAIFLHKQILQLYNLCQSTTSVRQAAIMDQQDKERIAQEKYGKGYDQLSTNEQKAVGGEYRKQTMAQEHGGNVHEAYSEMGKTQHSGSEDK